MTKGPINGYSLFHTLTEDNLAVSGATGEVKLKSNGDRNENGKNFTLLNAYLTGNNVAWKSNGVVELQENEKIAFHSNNADFNFATAGNIQPKALLKSCFSDTDCKGEESSCLDNGDRKCPIERISSKCQQELFAWNSTSRKSGWFQTLHNSN